MKAQKYSEIPQINWKISLWQNKWQWENYWFVLVNFTPELFQSHLPTFLSHFNQSKEHYWNYDSPILHAWKFIGQKRSSVISSIMRLVFALKLHCAFIHTKSIPNYRGKYYWCWCRALLNVTFLILCMIYKNISTFIFLREAFELLHLQGLEAWLYAGLSLLKV